MDGPLSRFFIEDHRRLGALLKRAAAGQAVEPEAYSEFRGGILRHVAMEERILIPAARRARGGQSLPVARLLRLDHGAIAALLVPPPTLEILRKIEWVLEPHNETEERPDGLYAVCDELLHAESIDVLAALRAVPEPPLAPHQDGPNVYRHIEETLARARRAWDEAAGRLRP